MIGARCLLIENMGVFMTWKTMVLLFCTHMIFFYLGYQKGKPEPERKVKVVDLPERSSEYYWNLAVERRKENKFHDAKHYFLDSYEEDNHNLDALDAAAQIMIYDLRDPIPRSYDAIPHSQKACKEGLIRLTEYRRTLADAYALEGRYVDALKMIGIALEQASIAETPVHVGVILDMMLTQDEYMQKAELSAPALQK